MSGVLGPARGLRDHWCGELRAAHVGQRVRCCGWVASVRTHGEHLRFVDLRDRSGIVQCVLESLPELRSEFVVAVEGTVRPRPRGTVNPALQSGEVELADCSVEVLGPAEPPPISLSDRVDADEGTRLRYRYLDLRRDRMQRNLRLRADVVSALRRAMQEQGFTEVETPLLWTPTPEGAREFAVPSRLQRGSFYVLPQSPQIAKQLLMVAGLDRYYQIARCLRDEDLRADRQFEFTQLDVEASFVTQDDVLAFVSHAVLEAARAVTGEAPPTIARMTWADAMDRYGTDKPDLRFGMELADLTEAFAATKVSALQAPAVKAICATGMGDLGRGRIDALVSRARELGAKGLAWFRVVGGDEIVESPLARHLAAPERQALVELSRAAPGDLVLAVADEHRLACEVLGQLRVELGRPPVAEGPHRYVWVVDFPLFDGLDEEGRPRSAHHPFTMPHPEDLDALESDPLSVRSQAYDLVLNGWELGSGSIRVHRADVQERVFAALGIAREEAEARFGFLTGAFRYGAPPHGGFAVGVDRLVAILAGEEHIREVIAFPKTQSGTDPMTGAPKAVAPSVLAELGIAPLPGAGRGGGGD
ncbi:MAG: aspartate--tRNA ligase, partial [Acidimicrobiales bacterium]